MVLLFGNIISIISKIAASYLQISGVTNFSIIDYIPINQHNSGKVHIIGRLLILIIIAHVALAKFFVWSHVLGWYIISRAVNILEKIVRYPSVSFQSS